MYTHNIKIPRLDNLGIGLNQRKSQKMLLPDHDDIKSISNMKKKILLRPSFFLKRSCGRIDVLNVPFKIAKTFQNVFRYVSILPVRKKIETIKCANLWI